MKLYNKIEIGEIKKDGEINKIYRGKRKEKKRKKNRKKKRKKKKRQTKENKKERKNTNERVVVRLSV
jgi:hypothetical protein